MSSNARKPKMAKVIELFPSALKTAIDAKQEFFDSLSPERKEKFLAMQAEIEKKLDKSGSQSERMKLIAEMMTKSLKKLTKAVRTLKDEIDETQAKKCQN